MDRSEKSSQSITIPAARARTLLGWEPKVHLAAGLSHTIDYFRKKVLG